MENNIKKKLGFSIGIFDNISDRIKSRILKESSECETYGVGVYTNDFVTKKFMTYPLKTQEERMETAKEIPGVNFVFLVDTADPGEIKDIIENEYTNFLKNNNN